MVPWLSTFVLPRFDGQSADKRQPSPHMNDPCPIKERAQGMHFAPLCSSAKTRTSIWTIHGPNGWHYFVLATERRVRCEFQSRCVENAWSFVMNTQFPGPELWERTVGDIAATLPGATAVFRKFKIDFCCNGDLTLDGAAHRRGVDPDELERALEALGTGAGDTAAPAAMDSDELIDHIEACYHEAHRRALPELIALSRKVEAVHREHPKVPAGLSDALRQMQSALEQHMAKEEAILFPAMRQWDKGKFDIPVSELRHEHDDQGTLLRLLESLTDDFATPDGACRSWQALYVGTAQLAEDLMEHIHLENNILFPRFAATESRA
ncbi:iron-sulfur cluster repair di-iron protein [Mesorhizobium sp. Root102]|uniref:iron-sulfur cluster repair di-iron protein n=1 Tax=Mesorhizobium sp. Root102 TaxID=1736422 RepID=UPI001FCD7497|nr:iron-sulfur cluster repair di-iron protein [Mesorhizobium sp. Root102]